VLWPDLPLYGCGPLAAGKRSPARRNPLPISQRLPATSLLLQ